MSSKNLNTRTRILNSTWKLLEAKPASVVRMSDIAKDVGISRQALYLHFPARAELLVATARHVDDVKQVDGRLAASRAALSGTERLEAFIDAWGNYIPEIHGVAQAFLAMEGTDEAAAHAWKDRMQAVREGCAAAVKMLKADGMLSTEYSTKQATDLLWTLLSVRNWEHLRGDCGWSQKRYIETTKALARQALIDHG